MQAAAISMMVETGRSRFKREDPEGDVFNALMKHLNIEYKDVVARDIELVIKKTDAIAIVKIDESWVVESKNMKLAEEWKGSYEHHPDAREALMSVLETPDYTRMMSVPFKRNKPKTGRVIGFDDPKIYGNDDKGTSTSGRFTHFFARVSAEKAEEKKSSPHSSGN